MNDAAEVMRHPQITATNRLLKIDCGEGQVEVLRAPVNIEGMEEEPRPVPAIGEHTRAVLKELGYAETEIDALEREGAV
jgi:crotonobetainyl-CoA:carnitine CoA-transferase CaiB-like acyl-CoA transferase